MPTSPPRAVLSEHLEARLRGRRLVAGVFLTFQFDPGFFEQDVLPTFFDIPLSHAAPIKLEQLAAAIRAVPNRIAVYYDQNGLVPGAGAARLDFDRIAVCHRMGIFHPKNVFALVEESEPDQSGHRAQALIVATMSANLTRAGWWQNVEVCHTEEITESDFTRLGDDLTRFCEDLERRVANKTSDGHAGLKAIRAFLRKTGQRTQRTTGGRLHTHFFDGKTPVVEFIERVTGGSLRNMNLEIISPYFDEHNTRLPLYDMLRRFHPRETRVFLPRNEVGETQCSNEVFTNVRGEPNVMWARLPADITRSGRVEAALPRNVHAKVYRFFRASPKREVLLIGSVNLTSAAHSGRNNVESGFLVELEPPHKPDWWLIPDSSPAVKCVPRSEDEGSATSGGSKLSVRFWWDTGRGETFWDSPIGSPSLTVRWQDVVLFALDSAPSREWITLDAAAAAELQRVLRSTSILTVAGDGKEPGLILVQEEGMHARPSLLFDLSPADILRYWSLLTPAQQAEFLNVRAPELAQTDEGVALLAQAARLRPEESFFDRFAGIFLAFGCLERAVLEALPGNQREATYRMFGQKYDSLPKLLSKIIDDAEQGVGDLTEHYVTALCSRQLVSEIERAHSQFFHDHRDEANSLKAQIEQACAFRDRINALDPARMPDFLEWFERWFLRRATPVEMVDA